MNLLLFFGLFLLFGLSALVVMMLSDAKAESPPYLITLLVFVAGLLAAWDLAAKYEGVVDASAVCLLPEARP